MLRNAATKNPLAHGFEKEILHGVYPESTEGLRMTMYDFWVDAACCDPFVTQ